MLYRMPDEKRAPQIFRLTKGRLNHVLAMVYKKVGAADKTRGIHFWVYPPRAFLDDVVILESAGIFQALRGTVWWVKWYDGQYDQLEFGEFLAFVDQILDAQRVFDKVGHALPAIARYQRSKHSEGWQPKKDRSKKSKPRPVKLRALGGLDLSTLIEDDYIRGLFKTTVIERTIRPEPH